MTILTSDPAAQGNQGNGSAPPGNQQPTSDWRSALPDDLRSEKVFESIKGKDWSEAGPLLAKNYVHAQRLVGTEKLALLTDKSTPEETNEFYTKLGRPAKPTEYQYKLPEGLTAENLDPARLDSWKNKMHELGLTSRQANELMSNYLAEENLGRQGSVKSAELQQDQWVLQIKQEYGDKFDENMNYARLALRDFGNPKLMEALESSGFGSHPEVVKTFANIGRALADDKARTGNGSGGNPLASPEAAQAALNAFNRDESKQKALFDDRAINHADVVKERAALFIAAFPPTKAE